MLRNMSVFYGLVKFANILCSLTFPDIYSTQLLYLEKKRKRKKRKKERKKEKESKKEKERKREINWNKILPKQETVAKQ